MKVKDCMCYEVCCVKPETKINEVAKLMSQNHIGSVPVCDNQNKVCGIVTDRDIILRTIACDKDCKTTKVSDIMTCNVCTCNENDDMVKAENIMSQNQIRRLPVIQNGQVVGMLTLGDLAANKQVKTEGIGVTLEKICGCDDKNAE